MQHETSQDLHHGSYCWKVEALILNMTQIQKPLQCQTNRVSDPASPNVQSRKSETTIRGYVSESPFPKAWVRFVRRDGINLTPANAEKGLAL
jgi:hypothetical protein